MVTVDRCLSVGVIKFLFILTVVCPTVITNRGYRLPLHPSSSPQSSSSSSSSSTDLLRVLLEQAELEALVQLQLADVPGLVEVLPGGVQFVQQLGDARHQALGVGVAHPAAAAAAASAAAAAAVAVGEGLAALDSLEQPEEGVNERLNVKAALLTLVILI